jgi:hypothetical protein
VRDGEYVLRRILGKKSPEVDRALVAITNLQSSVLDMIRLLGPKDFEILVDLVFSTSGWRRLGPVGKTQKTLDLDLTLPSTGERAFMQIKSKATDADLSDYMQRLDELGQYNRMFFVYHTGNVHTDSENVIVIGPEKLSKLIVDAGLASWLVQKVS